MIRRRLKHLLSALRANMTNPRNKLGLVLGILGVFLFGGTLPATRLAVNKKQFF
jgi:hypothetical protein